MRLALVFVLLSSPALAQDQVWTWTDEKGEEHYTNDKSSIPEKFRTKAKSTQGEELSVVKVRGVEPAPAPSPTPAPTPISAPSKTAARAGPIKVVLFEASTNSASKTLNRSGVIDKLVSNNPGLKLERLEFANAVERAEQLKVTQLPTVLFVDDSGTVIARTIGLVTLKELQQQLDKARGVQ